MLSKVEILEMKEELRNWSIEDLERKIQSLQSLKCRYGKIEKKKNEMELLLEKERIVREIIIEKKEKKVVIYERLKSEIDNYNMEEVLRGLKNIDSILCIERSKDEKSKNLEKIEKCGNVRKWIEERKEVVSGNNLGNIKISDLVRKISDLEDSCIEELEINYEMVLIELKLWILEKSK